MKRFLTQLFVLCLLLGMTSPLLAQGKGKGKNKPKNLPPVTVEKEDESRVTLAFDPGSHTRPISALGFNKDQTQLITVGWDYSIQIWSTKTGERLDIIRLPAYGRDNGFDTNRWNHAAISADGAYVAIGGGPKLLYGDEGVPTRLLVVDVANRRVRKLNFPVEAKTAVTCLSFSANGDRLAVGFGGTVGSVYIQDNVKQILQNEPAAKLPAEPALVVQGLKQQPHNLALSPSANKLVVAENRAEVTVFDVTGKAAANWKQIGEFSRRGQNDLLAWAPDESHFAFSWIAGDGKHNCGIELRSPAGELVKSWTFGDLEPGFGRQSVAGSFRYLAADRLYISAHSQLAFHDTGLVGVLLDPQTGQSVRRFEADTTAPYNVVGAASTSGTLAAITTQNGLEATIFNLTDGKVVARCGSRTPVPTIVGWSQNVKAPAIAWTDDAQLRPLKSQLNDLKYAFDLAQVEPVGKVNVTAFAMRQLEIGEWKLDLKSEGGDLAKGKVTQGDQETYDLPNSSAMTLITRGAEPPLLAHGRHDEISGMGGYAYLRDSQGTLLANLLPVATQVRDMVASPDGRYLLLSTGTHRLSIYCTDGSRFPFLNLVQANGEWVCWAPEGYFAASPGGEKLIGWAESKGSNELTIFHPAEKFSKHYYRPDLLKLAIQLGSLEAALEQQVETRAPAVEGLLPPKGELKLVKQVGNQVQVLATATPGAPDKPIVAMRLLLNGRPFGTDTQKLVAKGEKAEAIWNIEFPADTHELKLLVRGEDNSATSDPLVLTGPKSAAQIPVLHRLCVGVDQYALPALNLSSAAKDAVDVYGALEKHCVGEANRFGRVNGVLLTNDQATSVAVLKALNDIRKVAKPGDLLVMLFAGHGIQQTEAIKQADGSIVRKSEYYLMTHEADPSQSLQDKSLSGTQLRQALGAVGCPVLLLMDSCYSANGIQAFRSATDGLTRGLTDDSTGVTILAAAMSNEKASGTPENGYFTAAFLKALEVGQGVPYDPRDHTLYTHHIYSVVFSEVRYATNGKQNPFLHRPWAVPPLALRDVPITK
jgi:hypothetical protein